MKHESNRPLSSRPISAIFVRPQGFMEYSNVTWSPRGMTADESCYYRKPWSSSFSSQPHSQGFSVSIGGNVVGLFLPSGNASSSRAKFRVIVSFFWRHLKASKNDTTVISTYIMHISADRIKERRRILETKLAYSFHPGTQVLVESNLLLDFRVIISFFWRHLFGIQKRQNSTYSSETPWP